MPRLNLPYRNPLCQSAAGGVKTWLKGPRLATVHRGLTKLTLRKSLQTRLTIRFTGPARRRWMHQTNSAAPAPVQPLVR